LKEGENLRWLSRLSWFLCRSVDAERFAQAAVGLLESLPSSPQLAMAYSGLSQLRMLQQDRDGAILWGEKAIVLAQELNDDETLVHALNNVGTARLNSGDEAGRSQLERSLSMARERGLEEHVARAFTNLASASVSSFEFQSAGQYLGDGIRYSMDRDLDSWRLYMLGWHAISLFYRGAWDEATEAAGSILGSPTVSPVTRIQALIVLGRLRARRGDPQADTVLDEALALAALTGEPQRLLPVGVARAEAAWSVGQTEKAREEVAQMVEMALHTRHPWRSGEVLFWLWRTGAKCSHHDWIARPFLYQMSGDWANAASEWERLGCPYEAAQALADSGDEITLRRALAKFGRLGARRGELNVSRRLKALGARGIPRGPRPSTKENPGGLTSREIEILGFIRAGLRNSDIAERLYVSRKTVDHHVSSILSKLNVGSRTEAAREAVRLEIITQSR
ncbi:MAG: response regulator transcription factor, partial [Chloroflexota bacterium]|nr:response regulator transcription factor [Chloroflexota bacterium]